MMPTSGSSRHLLLCLLAAAPAQGLPLSAFAQPTVFTRVSQSGGMRQQEYAFAYGVEVRRGLAEYRKSNSSEGSGSGGGLGGRSDYAGVNHRLSATAGVTDWLTISLDQTIKQPQADSLEVGVLAPELRLDLTRLSGWLADAVPLQLSGYTEGRVRINARRRSSMVVGAVADRQVGRLWLTARAGFETTLDDQQRENGLRYELGASYALLEQLLATLEVWGSMVWPDYAVFQQDHHGGPSLRFARGWFFSGVHVAFGVKERPNKVFLDLSAMARLGVRY